MQRRVQKGKAERVPARKPQANPRTSTESQMTETEQEWEVFFSCQRHPILRSQLITAMMSGTVLDADRVPTGLLLDALLIATAARTDHNAEVVNTYDALVTRVREEWSKPDWTCRVFSSQHANKANWILQGQVEFCCAEDVYIPQYVGWLLQQDAPAYWDEDLPSSFRLKRRAA